MAGTKDALLLSGVLVSDPSQGIDVGAGAAHCITFVGWRGYGGCVSFQGYRGSNFIETENALVRRRRSGAMHED